MPAALQVSAVGPARYPQATWSSLAAYLSDEYLLDAHWMDVLRDACSRTNSALVRPASKAFFLERQFA